jgi:hypothetical protein
MTKRLIVATVAYALLLLQLGNADAGGSGPYDGEWKGTATSTGAGCKRGAAVNITVEGLVVLGQAKFEGDASSINGAVDARGTVGATIGFQFMTGHFSGDEFEGTFKFADCQWEANLKRTNAGNRAATSGMNSR